MAVMTSSASWTRSSRASMSTMACVAFNVAAGKPQLRELAEDARAAAESTELGVLAFDLPIV